MNPLELILKWFDSMSSKINHDFVVLSSHFHLDTSIENTFENSEQIKKFRDYLEPDLENKEIVSRSLYLIKLIDFTIAGRDTEAGWNESLDRNLDMKIKMKEKGFSSDIFDSFMDSFSERKSYWIEICSTWHNLTHNELSDKAIADWYFLKMHN